MDSDLLLKQEVLSALSRRHKDILGDNLPLFIENIVKCNPSICIYAFIEWVRDGHSFPDVLTVAFPWDMSKEGEGYWSKIYLKYLDSEGL